MTVRAPNATRFAIAFVRSTSETVGNTLPSLCAVAGQAVECLEAKKPVPTQRSKGEPVTSTIVHSQKLDLPTAGREVGLDRKGA